MNRLSFCRSPRTTISTAFASLLVVSACTPPGYINNSRHDFGSILRFIEFNASIPQGLCISRIRAPRAI